MQHLDSERLAAFDHESFSAEELAHIAACAQCHGEVAAFTQLVQLTGEWAAADDAQAVGRLSSWDAIAGGLRHQTEAVPATAPTVPTSVSTAVDATVAATVNASEQMPAPWRPRVSSGPWWSRPSLRAAAAVALIAGGMVLGRASAVMPTFSNDRLMIGANAESGLIRDGSPIPVGYAARGEFTTAADAMQTLARAQRDYERASVWLAVNDGRPNDSDVYRARLAALDQLMATSRAALSDAPQDPVLNQYYRSAYSAREATLQQLGTTLPVGTTIERY